VSAFYYEIGNLEAKFRSQLKHIHLALLVRHRFVTAPYSYASVLGPMLEDLKVLQTKGCDVVVNGEKITLACLASISSDNLSAHCLGGFRACFS